MAVDQQHLEHAQQPVGRELNRLALSATVHCLTGCAIGEVLGMVLATWWGWGDVASIALAVVLAFFFGYSLTSLPLLRSGMSVRQVAPLALASDTASIATMELVDKWSSSTTQSSSASPAACQRRSATPCSGGAWRSAC